MDNLGVQLTAPIVYLIGNITKIYVLLKRYLVSFINGPQVSAALLTNWV